MFEWISFADEALASREARGPKMEILICTAYGRTEHDMLRHVERLLFSNRTYETNAWLSMYRFRFVKLHGCVTWLPAQTGHVKPSFLPRCGVRPAAYVTVWLT